MAKLYGILGEVLGHSFSPMIHSRLADYDYKLVPVAKSDIDEFMKKRDFAALNVTIPYKKTVMPYCDELSPAAQKIGCVNTLVIKPDGRLVGDNTDYDGFLSLAKSVGIDFEGKTVVILGSGGTSLTTRTVAMDQKAKQVIIVSRSGEINYDNVYDIDADIIINTTPVGMFPNNDKKPIDLSKFKNLCGVLDVIYNPLKTALIMQAEELNIPCASGLRMLVAQAKHASERFTGSKIDDSKIDEIEAALRAELTNLVLIGMPGAGKTVLSKICAEKLGREMAEIDDLIVKEAGKAIPQIFADEGEEAFRNLESKLTKEQAAKNKMVISTGGGVIKRAENIKALHQNSIIVWVKRPIEQLATAGRPLSSKSDDAVNKLWLERKDIYAASCDFAVDNTGDINAVAEKILEGFYENIGNKRA